MAIVYTNCICGESFRMNIIGEGWIVCPFCKKKSYRKFDGKQETYIFLEEEDIKNDR